MKELLKELKNRFQNVSFTETNQKLHVNHEDCHYLNGYSPKPEVVNGEFIRMVNSKGGADTISVKNVESIYSLAAWHNER
jgi:hypothetical protein